MGVGEEGACPICLSSCPFTHPPSAVSPCVVEAICLEKLLSTICHEVCLAWLPCSLELLLPRPSLLAALGLGHKPHCLVSRPQPP